MKKVFVQGASGGIGSALVRALLARPDVERVVASSRSAAPIPGGPSDDPRLVVLPLDVTDEQTIQEAAVRLAEHVDVLHGLFNASGVLHDEEGLHPEKRLEDLDPQRLARSMAVNAIGPILVVRALLPFLRHGERSVVANLSAKVGSIGDNRSGGWYGYRSSKAALNMLTRTLALELARRAPNAICVALHPGTVETRLSEPFSRRVDPSVIATPDAAARRLLAVVDGLVPGDSGSFRSWDGSELPW